MKIFIEKNGERKNISFKGKVADLLDSLKIDKETVLVVSNGELVTSSDMLSDSDDVKIISVISGG